MPLAGQSGGQEHTAVPGHGAGAGLPRTGTLHAPGDPNSTWDGTTPMGTWSSLNRNSHNQVPLAR